MYAETILQVTSYRKTFEDGYLHQIRSKITRSLVNLSTTEQQRGGLEVTRSQNGNRLARVRSCGCMVNVSDSHVRTFLETNPAVVASVAGAGKSVLWYVDFGYNLYGSL